MPVLTGKYTVFVYKLTSFSNISRRIGSFHVRNLILLTRKVDLSSFNPIKGVITPHILFKKHTLKITTITSIA